MSQIISDVDQRTQLAGSNRLELLLFRLGRRQRYGINVFKVREAIPCPPLTKLPYAHPMVAGITSIRGKTVSVLDLSMAIGGPPQSVDTAFVILTEYNRSVQGFLVSHVDRIINLSWSDVLSPPDLTGKQNYLTAITKQDDEIIEIIDVERVLSEVIGLPADVSESVIETHLSDSKHPVHILVAEDSSVARNQIKRTLDKIGVQSTIVNDGREALEQLRRWVEQGHEISDYITMLISDIEMPEMDGYTLTTEIRKDPQLKDLKVLLHTSMSGSFNESLVEKVGADQFLPKYSSEELAIEVQKLIRRWQQEHPSAENKEGS